MTGRVRPDLQRTVQGVQVPTLADVGVRVYDGKVVHLRRHHVPLAEDLQLPGTVDLDQAKQTAGENVPCGDHAPVLWFDEEQRVLVTADGQRNVWDLFAELKLPTTPENRLEFSGHWQIDANSGEVLLSDGIDPAKDVELRRRCYAAGGEHVSPDYDRPQPDVIVEDRQPVFTPDGGVLFLSDRARPGYPQWLQMAERGLLEVAADGSSLRCVFPEMYRLPQFSPSGTRMLLREQDGLHVVPLDGGEEVLIPKPSGGGFLSAGWASDTMLLADSGDAFGGGELMKVDLTHPETHRLLHRRRPLSLSTCGRSELLIGFLLMHVPSTAVAALPLRRLQCSAVPEHAGGVVPRSCVARTCGSRYSHPGFACSRGDPVHDARGTGQPGQASFAHRA